MRIRLFRIQCFMNIATYIGMHYQKIIKLKVALRELYRDQYGYDNYSDELVEEMIITDLGRIHDFGNYF